MVHAKTLVDYTHEAYFIMQCSLPAFLLYLPSLSQSAADGQAQIIALAASAPHLTRSRRVYRKHESLITMTQSVTT